VSKVDQAYKVAFLQHLDELPLPDLGKDSNPSVYKFTDREIDTIAFAVSFTERALMSSPLQKIRRHYGAALQKLAARFQSEDLMAPL
jgi:hypothetical protein